MFCKKTYIVKKVVSILLFVFIFTSLNLNGIANAVETGELNRGSVLLKGNILPDVSSSNPNILKGFKIEVEGANVFSLTDSKGYFEIQGIPQNQTGYSVKISKTNYLTRTTEKISFNKSIALGSETEPVSIWAGDMMQDNLQDGAINMSDIVELIRFFNSAQGSPFYNSDADFNMDTAVNMEDILVIIQHFNKSVADYPGVKYTEIDSTPTPTNSPSPTPVDEKGNLKITESKISETDTDFKYQLIIENPNTTYAWNGSYFAIWNITFETSSTLVSAKTDSGSPVTKVEGEKVTLDLGWLSFFPLGKKLTVTMDFKKAGSKVYPQKITPHYVRSEDIAYPNYEGLPSSWTKNKPDLSEKDLIANPASYYSAQVNPVNQNMIVYNPYHPTQIWIGQPKKLSHPMSTTPDIRIWIPSKFMAMGMGFNYELLKLNPNYMTAMGTKENFACGLAPEYTGANSIYKVTLDGQNYIWPIQAHQDGPFQQETPNFNDMRDHMKDFFPGNAVHDDYTFVKEPMKDDLKFVTAAICSGLSITVTRETLHAIPAAKFKEFISQAKDPWAEYVLIDYAYNRGLNSLLSSQALGAKRQEALNSLDVSKTLGLTGFGDHVNEIRWALIDINNDTANTYDAQITWADMESFLTKLKVFYSQGVPSDATWTEMKNDTKRAFDILAKHWGGNYISYRYDFLTLMRVIKAYLPQPYNPRPTGDSWYYLIKGAIVQ
ncbi:MAG: dockerin type I domain-containing protein [Clostridia bacterium]|nr:dockerin type I domain-containing protein [Clostridia bacterium]